MSNTLKTIQVLHKIGKILSKIAFVCAIVGAVGCLAGIICLACGAEGAFKLGGVTIHSIIVGETGMTTDQMISTLVVWTILSAADAVLARFAGRYFKNELTAGTPFTLAGAKELLRLGILTIALPLGSYIAAAIVNGILAAFLSGTWETHVDQGGAIMLGVMFIVLSVILKYGAELEGKKENEA